MSNDEILVGNKLIAEFMGYKYYPKHKLNDVEGVLKIKGKVSLHATLIDKSFCTKYHSSWNWLIPVAEKFCKLKYTFPTKKHYHKQVSVALKNGITTFDLNNAWADVVMAVKWYNENKVE